MSRLKTNLILVEKGRGGKKNLLRNMFLLKDPRNQK